LSQCYIERGVLKRKQWRSDKRGLRDQYIVPMALRDVVLLAMHEDATAGHQGMNRTVERLLESFWWPTVTADTAWWCRACLRCQARKGKLKRSLPLCIPRRATAPGDTLGIDILGPLPTSSEGYMYLLVIIDLFTRWVELAPLTKETNSAEGVAGHIVDLILCRGGAPRKIVSDRGKHFTAKVSQALYDYMRTKKATTSAYRPQSDGQTERVMPQAASYLSMYVSDYQTDWPKYLHLMRLALNTAVCRITGVSPHELATGRSPRLPWSAMAFEPEDCVRRKESAYVADLRARQRQLHDIANTSQALLDSKLERRQEHLAPRLQRLTPGTKVWAYATQTPTHIGGHKLVSKLQSKWCGPYEVLEDGSPTAVNARIAMPGAGPRGKAVHKCYLRKFIDPRETPPTLP
ncbi:unnamed protein product, partial [Phaeothamnion confervicola]